MKKTLAIVGMIVLAAAAFAGGSRETRTVEGKIAIVDSFPTLSDGATNWVLPPGAFYQIAWENGIRIGDAVKVEGFAFDRPDEGEVDGDVDGDKAKTRMIMPTRVWAGGKELDLSNIRMGGRGPLCGDGRGPDGFDRPARRDRRDHRGCRDFRTSRDAGRSAWGKR